MLPRFSLAVLLAVGLCLAGSDACAQQSQGTPFDPGAVLATLKDLKTKQQTVVSRERSNVTASINAAIADPAKYYDLAVAAVEFQNGTGNDAMRLTEWRKRHAADLRNRDFIDALRQQLIYINLSWQHSTGVKTKDQLGTLLDYASQIARNSEVYGQFDFARKSLGESVFVPYFQLGPYINNMPEWSDRPFDVEALYEKTIFPALRTEKNPRLLDCWRDRIQFATTRAGMALNALASNKYNNVRLPTLLWSRAEDEVLLGMTNQAVGDMLGLIKTHPDHPDFDRWTARLTEIVSPPKASEAPPAPGAPAAPAAGQ